MRAAGGGGGTGRHGGPLGGGRARGGALGAGRPVLQGATCYACCTRCLGARLLHIQHGPLPCGMSAWAGTGWPSAAFTPAHALTSNPAGHARPTRTRLPLSACFSCLAVHPPGPLAAPILQGKVLQFDSYHKRSKILYDDGEEEWVSLAREKFRWLTPRGRCAQRAAGREGRGSPCCAGQCGQCWRLQGHMAPWVDGVGTLEQRHIACGSGRGLRIQNMSCVSP